MNTDPHGTKSEAVAANATGRAVLGIKAKLFLAISAMAIMTISASAVAWFAFVEIGRSVTRITAESVPAMAASLRLAEKSAEIAATAPALMASTNQEERIGVQTRLEEKARELVALTEGLKATGIEQDIVRDLADIQERITESLKELSASVEKRLRLKVLRAAAAADLAAAHGRFLETLEPLVDDSIFNLVITGEDVTAQSTKAITNLVEGGVSTLRRLLTLHAEGNLVAGLLAEAANVSDPILIQPIRERFIAAAATMARSLNALPDTGDKKRLQQAMDVFLDLGSGEENIFKVRRRELREPAITRETLQAKRERMVAALREAHETLLETVTPIVDDASFDLVITGEDVTAQSTKAITNLVEGGVSTLRRLLTLRAEGNLVAGLLAEAANVSDPTLIQPIRERFIAAIGHIEGNLEQLPESADNDALRKVAEALGAFGTGNDGIFSLRQQELDQIAAAENSLKASRSLAIRLGDEVSRLVIAAQASSDEAAVRSDETINSGELLLLAIIAISIAGASLIMFYYVAPQVVKPLANITMAMSDLAAGDTSVDIPGRNRGDEIGHMAQALGVFRDTAIELQKSNLKEIGEARRRLTDAIESISEGFSLYDSEDRLVVCNNMYRTLLYSGIADEITLGTMFETIIRHAAERGYIEDAQNRVEEWIEERLALHREPSGSYVERRGDGRWILVSERKTEDGGTVAVYSDITELKQREEELARKSNEMELLSNQLAKYLSPQVYESIFSGKQEVKLSSRRKKLTIFFSDIVGFTETADKLESEDLTQLLNHYLTEMSQIALEFGATIDKYVGDAIVIFFGDPETRGVKEDALACVRMAIAMRKKMGELESVWRALGIEKPLQCRIGISTGYCTVGNFGSEDRMDYTIIGGGVNLASRLETAATPGEVLISYETYAHVNDQIHCEDRGYIDVKGISYPVATYQVVDSYDNLGKDRQLIREDHPNLKLDLDLDAMSADQRCQAATVLRQALDRLSAFDQGAMPGPPAKEDSDRAK